MSWKRVLKAARRLGTPVIIADEMGEDPFVVMPLSKYESLVDEGDLIANLSKDEEVWPGEMEEHFHAMDPRLEKVFEDQIVSEMQNLAKQKEKLIENPSIEPLSVTQENGQDKEEMPLEDRFYFEPMEDEFKK